MDDSPLASELARFRQKLTGVGDANSLYALQVEFLGKKGSVTVLRKQMGKLAPEDRKAFGQAFNEIKRTIEAELEGKKADLDRLAREADLARFEDLTFVQAEPPGTLHPITQTRRALEASFARLGFSVAEGPHIESEAYNFDSLNILPEHPARDMQDTFFVEPRGGTASQAGIVLRTHTSPVQVRTMLTTKPPIRIVAPGTVFRRDDDATHSPMFNQIEGLYIDVGVTMADLKDTLYRFVSDFFGASLKVRFRPSYFPFVEPGAEFDVQCPFCLNDAGDNDGCGVCKRTGFIELGGSGMVHPKVFEACGIDPERYTGWAFGFGIDRMAMLRHKVDHLRHFFEGDVRFLEQFPC